MHGNKSESTGYKLLFGLQILVLEDEPDNLDLLTYILETSGASVIVATSVPELILRGTKVPVDIVLVSIKTIKKYALAQATEIVNLKIPKDLLLIAVFDSRRTLDWQAMTDLGCCCHFCLPLEAEEIIFTILNHIREPHYRLPQRARTNNSQPRVF